LLILNQVITPQRWRAAMNRNVIEGRWKFLKGSIKERLGKWRGDDFLIISGRIEQRNGKLQRRSGRIQSAAE